MSQPSASQSLTIRTGLDDETRGLGLLTSAVGAAGGVITAVDILDTRPGAVEVELTVNAVDDAHAATLTAAVEAVPDAHLRAVRDRTFSLHAGGKLEIRSRAPLHTADDLSMAYTPGVARVCEALAADPARASELTIKRNTVAVVTDGSAVLGLGGIGATAALPVMEGKAALFKEFAGVDAWPVCIDSTDPDEIVRTVELIAPSYGGINLEDISAPRCFDIESRLQDSLDIPVFHDDQHGTAIVVLAALRNALQLVGKRLADVRIVLAGAGAAGTAIFDILRTDGAASIVMTDRKGVLHPGRDDLGPVKRRLAETSAPPLTGSLHDALAGADVFIGVSGPNILTGDDIATMADDAIVFALANPYPEVDPGAARAHAAVVATGRSDVPNQINNVLAFPGVFRGALDAGARDITPAMQQAAARALADVVAAELRPDNIFPNIFHPGVTDEVASAVREAASMRPAR